MNDVPQLVPQPRSITRQEGELALPARLTFSSPVEWADVVIELLTPGTGLRVVEVDQDAFLTVERTDGPDSAYSLVTTSGGIAITASDGGGVAAAVATLRQLMPDHVFGPAPLPGAVLSVPLVEIDDEPRFGWRGMHLDVSRHFMPLPFLYRYVDLLAAHKFNRFHLHLNDDQGWRFEVPGYPGLTSVGAVRPESVMQPGEEGDGTPHGGFYTADQLRTLNAYAARRGITVVPEVDVPGHVRALLAAYPEFGENPPPEPATGPGIFPEVLHLSDATLAMVEDVFAAVLDIFDSPWIHIGGDECPTTQWENSQDAHRLVAERGLEGIHALQPWFTRRLQAWLAERGRQVIGWDEITEQGEMPGAVVMSWRGGDPGRAALAMGHEVIMSSNIPYYFDYYQSEHPGEPLAQPVLAPWEAVARFDPTEGVAPEHLDNLLGVQGQIWTEFITSTQHVEYMLFPRAAVLAEVAWHGPVDPDELEPRLRAHLSRLDAAGVNYRPLDGPHPWQQGGTGRFRRR